MTRDETITTWLNAFKAGDDEAATKLWTRYFSDLVRMAERDMADLPRRVYNEEDAAQSALHSLLRGVRGDHFPDLKNSNDLWRLLLTLTRRKITARRRHELAKKRGGGDVRGESVFLDTANNHAEGIASVSSKEPPPEFMVDLADEARSLLKKLSEPLKEVAILKMNGLTNGEIAERQGLTRRSIERKLERIRRSWKE